MSSSRIHDLAYVDPQAEIGSQVSIGPHCFVGPGVTLGDNCVLHNNVTVTGRTTCGRDNVFFPGSAVGVSPQDLKYKGQETRVEVGDDNVFREQVTVHAGTEVGGALTRIGSHNRFLVGVHVAHDNRIGNHCILANYVQLAGHVHLEDRVTMGGLIGVHHFTTIGTLSYIGGLTRIVADVPPYMIVEGNPSRVRGFNKTGMERWGFTPEQVRSVREAYRALFTDAGDRKGASMLDRLDAVESRADLNGEVRHLCASIRRSLNDGVYGRYLERARQDSDADRRDFYKDNARSADTEGLL